MKSLPFFSSDKHSFGLNGALAALIQTAREIQKKPIAKIPSEINYFNEFCYLKLKGARQTGHSTAIGYCIAHYKLKAAVFAMSLEMAEILKRQKVCSLPKDTALYSVQAKSLRGVDFSGFDAIFVDTAFFCDTVALAKIREIALQCAWKRREKGKTFVYVELE